MDHLSGRDTPESSLAIDFSTGLSLESNNPTPVISQLPCNNKGHYIRDVVQYLTMGYTNNDGNPTINIIEGDMQSAELQTMEFHPVEFYDMSVADEQHDERVLERSRENLLALHARVHCANAATLASMCHTGNQSAFNSTVSASVPCDHGVGTSSELPPGHLDGNQGQRSRQAAFDATKPHQLHESRRCRSSSGFTSMAMHGGSRPNEALQQCPRRMDSLCGVQPSSEVHTQEGQPGLQHQEEPFMVQRVLGELRALMRGRMPAAAICATMQRKIDAEEVLLRAIDKEISKQTSQGYVTPKAKASTRLTPTRPMLSSTASTWEVVQSPPASPLRNLSEELNQHLTEDRGGEGSSCISPRRTTSCCPGSTTSNGDASGQPTGNSLRTGDELKTNKMMKPQSLSHKMGAKVMLLATTMLAMASSTLTSFSLDYRDGLWEVACAPHSWLSDAAQRQGLQPRRINLESGYDLHRKETWQRLHALRRQHRPRRISLQSLVPLDFLELLHGRARRDLGILPPSRSTHALGGLQLPEGHR